MLRDACLDSASSSLCFVSAIRAIRLRGKPASRPPGVANLGCVDAEQIAAEVAERVREQLSEAEERAARIVREAEEEAVRIRERAEAEGQERLGEVRTALAELEGRLIASGASPGGRAEVEPGPVTVPEPTPDPVPDPAPGPSRVPEPTPEPSPEPTPERIPEPTPPPDEGTPPTTDPSEGAGARNGDPRSAGAPGDAVAARLVAMNMALDGSSREQIEAALSSYAVDDRERLVDEVLARAGQ